MESNCFDVIVAGAGTAGLISAATVASRGLRVALVSTGPGSFVFGAGCVDLRDIDRTAPCLKESVDFFCDLTKQAGCAFFGGLDDTHYVPTILGSFQPVSLAPSYMWNGDPRVSNRVAVIGIKGLSSFDSQFAAERLAFHTIEMGLSATYAAYEIKLSTEPDTLPGTLQYGNRYDRDAHFREELRDALKPIAAKTNVILLPGILGLKSGQAEIEWMEKQLNCKICELSTLPPSIPGLRLFNRLEAYLRQAGVEFYTGFPIQQLLIEDHHYKAVLVDTPARPLKLKSEALVLATGPFSGKLIGMPSFEADQDFRPLDSTGALIADNLFAAGSILHTSHAQGGNAMAILTGYAGGMHAAGVGVQYAQK